MKKQVGIFGGTFDPIHLGHLMTAEVVRDYFHLDQIVFIPAAEPPHKALDGVSEARHRYHMTELAIAGNPHFAISDIEMHRKGPSYSRDTLAELLKRYDHNREYFFIVGADSVVNLHTWRRPHELLEMCHFIGASRPGCLPDMRKLQTQFGTLAAKIHCLETPELEISSTDIRQRVRDGKTIRYLVPDAVAEYIYAEKLYLSV